ncbi:g3386 [Coccomyxa elongata]
MESWRAEAAAQDKKDPASNGAELWRTQPFFKSLIEEIGRVDGHLERTALRILNLNGWTSRLRLGALRVMCRSAEERARAKLAEEIHWCQQYAAINRIALQRLMEQYDRCSNSNAGARFLQECWSPESSLGTFLKTPLLDELHSLKLLLVGECATKELTHGLLASPRPSRQEAALSRSSVPARLASKTWDTCSLPAGAHAKSGPLPDIPKSCFAA